LSYGPSTTYGESWISERIGALLINSLLEIITGESFDRCLEKIQ